MSTYLKRQSIVMSLKTTATEKKLGGVLYNDQTDGLSSADLNSLTALTFNPKPAEDMFKILTIALDPQQNTWQTLVKAVIVTEHLAKFGAERCVDHCWAVLRRIEALGEYNSALVKTSFGTTGGRDNGAPVRTRAKPFADFLNDPKSIRETRTAAQASTGSICGVGVGLTDDYASPSQVAQAQQVDSGSDSRAFGSSVGGSSSAKYDLSHVPGMYVGRPDRFFDDLKDPRRHHAAEDSHITRNALAADLLDMDFGDSGAGGEGEAAAVNLPSAVQNLAHVQQERKLQEQLAEQQRQLEMLQSALAATNVSGGGGGGISGGMGGGSGVGMLGQGQQGLVGCGGGGVGGVGGGLGGGGDSMAMMRMMGGNPHSQQQQQQLATHAMPLTSTAAMQSMQKSDARGSVGGGGGGGAFDLLGGLGGGASPAAGTGGGGLCGGGSGGSGETLPPQPPMQQQHMMQQQQPRQQPGLQPQGGGQMTTQQQQPQQQQLQLLQQQQQQMLLLQQQQQMMQQQQQQQQQPQQQSGLQPQGNSHMTPQQQQQQQQQMLLLQRQQQMLQQQQQMAQQGGNNMPMIGNTVGMTMGGGGGGGGNPAMNGNVQQPHNQKSSSNSSSSSSSSSGAGLAFSGL